MPEFSAFSAPFRRTITGRKTRLASLETEATTVLSNTSQCFSFDRMTCQNSLVAITSTSSALTDCVDSIRRNAEKWREAIEEADENDLDEQTERDSFDSYFKDPDDMSSANSVLSIESCVSSLVSSLSSRADLIREALERLEKKEREEECRRVQMEHDQAMREMELESRKKFLDAQYAKILSGESAIPVNPIVPPLINASNQHATASVPLPTLPPLPLPTFSGGITDWRDFLEQFEDIVGKRADLADQTKLRYFKSCFRGDALDTLNQAKVVDYQDALRQMETEFSSTLLSEEHLIAEWRSIRPKNDSCKELLRVVRELESIHSQLKKIGAEVSTHKVFVSDLQHRFPSRIQKDLSIAHSTAIALSQPFTAEKLLTVVKELAQQELNVQAFKSFGERKEKGKPMEPRLLVTSAVAHRDKKSKAGGQMEKKSKETSAKDSTYDSPLTSQKCVFCEKHTNSFRCYFSRRDRLEAAKKKGRCLACLMHGHTAATCKRRCACCLSMELEASHHLALCPQLTTPSPQKPRGPGPPKKPMKVTGNPVQMESEESGEESPLEATVSLATSPGQIRMLTGQVHLHDPTGASQLVDVFCDSGAHLCLISEKLSETLQLKSVDSRDITLVGLGGASTGRHKRRVVEVPIPTSRGVITVQAVEHPEPLCGKIPLASLSSDDRKWIDSEGIQLAYGLDKRCVEPKLLIGGKYFYHFVPVKRTPMPSGLLLIPTPIGNMVVGEPNEPFEKWTHAPMLTVIEGDEKEERDTHTDDENLSRFLGLDSVGMDSMTTEKEYRKLQEQEVHDFFTSNTKFRDGYYFARYALDEEKVAQMSDGFPLAWNRLKSMYAKLQKDPRMLETVNGIIEKQIDSNQLEDAPPDKSEGTCMRYIPWQIVQKTDSMTTPVRVVIDASAKLRNEPSLNDCQKGPGSNHLEEIPKILLRVSLAEVLVAADLEKAFLQIKIFEDQRDMLRILWVKDPSQPLSIENIRILRYCSAAFGLKQSPFLLMQTMKAHAERKLRKLARPLKVQLQKGKISSDTQGTEQFKKEIRMERFVLNSLLRLCYVDNLFFSCPKSMDLGLLFRISKRVFSEMGMNPRTYLSSQTEFVLSLPDGTGDRGPIGVTKLLGIGYDTVKDSWLIEAKFKNPVDRKGKEKSLSKRSVLSDTASVYDPLGWVLPLMVPARVFIQELWKNKEYEWDTPLNERDTSKWWKIVNEATLSMSLPRRIQRAPGDTVTLALFSDASQVAMGACVYLCSPEPQLLMAKCQLAPAKTPKTIPKLELQALVLGMRLLKYVVSALLKEFSGKKWRIRAFTDASTVLFWLLADTKVVKEQTVVDVESGETLQAKKGTGVYVRNRITAIRELEKEILTLIPTQRDNASLSNDSIPFSHVSGIENPADHATRGLSAKEISDTSHLWWRGPPWLAEDPSTWEEIPPNYEVHIASLISAEERVTIENSFDDFNANVAAATTAPEFLIDVSRFSDINRLKRATVYVLRFLKKKIGLTLWSRKFPTLSVEPDNGPPSIDELDESMTLLVRQHQQHSLRVRPVNKNLGAFVDEKGVMRASSGRIDHALIPESAKQPVLLFHLGDGLPQLIIWDLHKRLMHAGKDLVLNTLREFYWLTSGRATTNKVIHKCVPCRKALNRCYKYPQAPPLPSERVNASRVFQHVGLDFLGPFKVREDKEGKNEPEKAYVLLITCMSTRAVHLEVTRALSACAFMNALERFVARRGAPESITSDNAPAFKVADAFLRERFKSFHKDPEIVTFCATQRIKWMWITPHSPWKGGFYERLVGSVKSAFSTTYGRRIMRLDELVTQITKIEAVLNTRPLSHVSADFRESIELPVIRPIDFLIPRVRLSFPSPFLPQEQSMDPDYSPPGEYSPVRAEFLKRFEATESVLQKFWNAFRTQYLLELREHARLHPLRAHTNGPVPFPGEIVLVVEENTPRGSWKMAKVLEVHEREAKILTLSHREVLRPFNQLIPLELVSSDYTLTTNTGPDSIEPEIPAGRPTRAAAEKARERLEALDWDQELPVEPADYKEKAERLRLSGGRLPGSTVCAQVPFCAKFNGSPSPHFHWNLQTWSTLHLTMLCFLSLLSSTSAAPAVLLNGTIPSPTIPTISARSSSLSCKPNGAVFHYSGHFPPGTAVRVCGEGECSTILTDGTRPYQEFIFPPSVTVHEYLVSAKYEDQKRVIELTRSCPATDFCESIACSLCIQALMNPECSPYAAIATLLFFLYILGLSIVACCCNPVILGTPFAFAFRCLKHSGRILLTLFCRLIRYCFSTRRAATRRQRSAAMVFIVTVGLLAQSVHGCQNVLDLSTTERRCLEGGDKRECTERQNILMMINPISRDACATVTRGGELGGMIRLTLREIILSCRKDVLGFHRDVSVLSVDSKRCYRAGSCVEGKCSLITPDSKVPELHDGNEYPGHTYCVESCGGLSCDCFWPSSACLFYRTFTKPRNEEVYTSFECSEWKTSVIIDFSVTFLNETLTQQLLLRPNLRKKVDSHEIELNSFSLPVIPSLSRKFIYDSHGRTALLTTEPIVHCNSTETARSLACVSTEECKCNPAETVALCDCKQSSLEDNFGIEHVLPIETPSFRMFSLNGVPKVSLLQAVSTQVALSLDTSKWKMVEMEEKQIECHIETTPLVGCYDCLKGAKANLKCTSPTGATFALLKCTSDAFTLPCSPEGITTERSFAFNRAAAFDRCEVSCGPEVELHGVLKYTTNFFGVNSLRVEEWHNLTVSDFKFELPDIPHIINILTEYWKSMLIGMLAVIAAIAFTSLFGPYIAMSCMTRCLTCCMRAPYRPKSKKEL